jgi:hypothetical protein
MDQSGKRTRVPAAGLAAQLAKSIAADAFFGEAALDRHIAPVNPSFNDKNTRYAAELLVVCYLPYDMIIGNHLGAHAERVSAMVRGFLLGALNDQRTALGEPRLSDANWDAFVNGRCVEYAECLSSGMAKENLWKFASLAAQRIDARDAVDPRIAMPIVIQFTGALKHMGPAVDGYEIAD